MDMSEPRLSVVIPTYNRAPWLLRTLSSLYRQTLDRQHYEIIVADDGSSDGTRELVTRYPERNVRYVAQADCGYRAAAARNLGIRDARSPICLLLDSDILASPTLLKQHLSTHESSSRPTAVIGYLAGLDQGGHGHHQRNNAAIQKLIDPADVDGTIERLEAAGFSDIRESVYYRRYSVDLETWPAPWIVFWSGNVSVPTATLHQVGLFDESFVTWGGEDLELGIRLFASGVAFKVNRDAKGVHQPHPKLLASVPENEQRARRRTTYGALHRKHQRADTAMLLEVDPPADLNAALMRDSFSVPRKE